MIKPEIRVLGVDDGKFTPHTKGEAMVVGVVFRGGYWLDGIMHTKITVDGFDATELIASMILCSPHYKQLRLVMLNGITFAGFNVVDIKKLNLETGLPVVVVTREKPDLEAISDALRNLPDPEKRWKSVLNAGEIYKICSAHKEKEIYVEIAGLSLVDARKIVLLTSTRSSLPEPLRVAHLIASGLSP